MRKRILLATTTLCLLPLSALAQGNYSGTHSGEGTFYGYSGGGNCSLPVPTMPTAAMNHADYNTAQSCGACIEVTNLNTLRSVTVRVDDRCPECAPGDVDLSQAAFAQISPIAAGRIPIRWRYVSCEVSQMKLNFKEGSSQWWAGVQVREHRNPVKSLAYRASGSNAAFTPVNREMYNYFIAPSGMGPGPFDFQLTDVFDQVVIASNVRLTLGSEVATSQQFPQTLGSGGNTGGDTGGGTTAPKPASTSLSPINDWGSGYCTNVNVGNPNATPLNWSVSLNIAGTVSTQWNATLSQSGGTLNASGVDWNRTLAPGATTQFGFCANR